MGSTPCGCDLDAAARRDPDERGREVLLGDAATLQRRWGCTFAGGDGVTRDEGCRATLGAVEALVGAAPGEYRGCPCATLRTDDSDQVLSAYRWWKVSQLALRVGHPTAALVEAIDLVHSGLSQREADDIRRIRESDPAKTPPEK